MTKWRVYFKYDIKARWDCSIWFDGIFGMKEFIGGLVGQTIFPNMLHIKIEEKQ